jgi:hypothetical protein
MNASWFADVIASANETLTDRRLFFRHAAWLMILGAVLRFAYLFRVGLAPHPSEAYNVAAAFATRGELADAWGPGTGPTAHLSPGMPLLVGDVYRWFGVGTPAAEFALACISLAFVYVSILALNAAFERLGMAPIARFGAIALLCLLPLNIFLEMRKFRQWEGALAAAGIAVCLARSLKMDGDQRRPSWLDLGMLAFGASVLSLFSEAGALACYGIIGWLALRRRGWLGLIATAAVSAALISALSYPWALRNEAVFGEKVWTRTAFGFNFAVGFHDRAISPAPPSRLPPGISGNSTCSRAGCGGRTKGRSRSGWPCCRRSLRSASPAWRLASHAGIGDTYMSRRRWFCRSYPTSWASPSIAIATRSTLSWFSSRRT